MRLIFNRMRALSIVFLSFPRGIRDSPCTVLMGVLSLLLRHRFKLPQSWSCNGSFKGLIVHAGYDVCGGSVFQSYITVLGINEQTPGSDAIMFESVLTRSDIQRIEHCDRHLIYKKQEDCGCYFESRIVPKFLL